MFFSFFRISRVFFSTSRLAIMIWCPQPRHFRRKSAPTLRISHSLLPQGCVFFIRITSPTSKRSATILPFLSGPAYFSSINTPCTRKRSSSFTLVQVDRLTMVEFLSTETPVSYAELLLHNCRYVSKIKNTQSNVSNGRRLLP